ncbi:MAG: hypothetical protein AAF969_12945 [Bacteroidota bacterium]
MNSGYKYALATSLVYVWLGFVGGISFMEAWLKFKAPGITLPLGLGIGRLVFNALNHVEWVLFTIILINLLVNKGKAILAISSSLGVAVIILLVQTLWLLPALDVRAEIIVKGYDMPPSSLHLYYVALEVVKVIALLWFGIKLWHHKATTDST